MSRAREWARDEREEVADGIEEWAHRYIFCECSMCWPIDEGPVFCECSMCWPIDEGPGPMVCGGAS